MSIGRNNEFVHFAVERPLERGSQLGHEEQRTAQEDHGSVDRASGGKAGDGLRGHCGEDRCCQVRFGRAIVDERLQIGFGEHAATRGDRIQGFVLRGHLVEAGGVGVEQRGHLVNERAGTTCARTVHTLFRSRLEVGDFRVFAAKFDDYVRLRIFLIDGFGFGDDFLNERARRGYRRVQDRPNR